MAGGPRGAESGVRAAGITSFLDQNEDQAFNDILDAAILRRRLNSFGSRSLQGILGFCWLDFVSNERLLRDTEMRFVICIICERQLWLYGHVSRFPETDPAH